MIDENYKNNQLRMCYAGNKVLAQRYEALMELICCEENPLTEKDFKRLIEKNPGKYGMFEYLLDEIRKRANKNNNAK